jgi:hypothetical protein
MQTSKSVMDVRTKTILMNVAVLTALAYQYWKGTPLLIIVLTGIFMLILVNLLMIFAAKKKDAKTQN